MATEVYRAPAHGQTTLMHVRGPSNPRGCVL